MLRKAYKVKLTVFTLEDERKYWYKILGKSKLKEYGPDIENAIQSAHEEPNKSPGNQ